VKERGNLSMVPELGLKTALSYVENVEEFGHRVHIALLQVSLSLTTVGLGHITAVAGCRLSPIAIYGVTWFVSVC